MATRLEAVEKACDVGIETRLITDSDATVSMEDLSEEESCESPEANLPKSGIDELDESKDDDKPRRLDHLRRGQGSPPALPAR